MMNNRIFHVLHARQQLLVKCPFYAPSHTSATVSTKTNDALLRVWSEVEEKPSRGFNTGRKNTAAERPHSRSELSFHSSLCHDVTPE